MLQERGYDDIMLFNPDGDPDLHGAEERRLRHRLLQGQRQSAERRRSRQAVPPHCGDAGRQRRLRRLLRLRAGRRQPESFIATPVYKADKLAGVLVFEISANAISDKRELDPRPRPDRRGTDRRRRWADAHASRMFSDDPNVLVTPVHVDIVDCGYRRRCAPAVRSAAIAASRWSALAAPFEFDGTKWAVVAVQTEAEVFAPVTDMRNTMLLVGGGAAADRGDRSACCSRASVTKPITRLTGTMKALAEGHLDVEVKGSGRSDEIGEMARTVEVFRENALKVTSMTEEERAGIGTAPDRAHDDDAGAAAGVRRGGRCGGQRAISASGSKPSSPIASSM